MEKKIFEKIRLGEEITKADIIELTKEKESFEKYTILRKVLRTLKKKRAYLIQQKHLYEKKDDSLERENVKKQIRDTKKIEEIIRVEISHFTFPERKKEIGKKRLPAFLRMQISNLNDIYCMQYLLDEDTKELLQKFENEEVVEKKLSLMEKLILRFEELIQKLQQSLDEILSNLLVEVKKNGDYKCVFKGKKIKRVLSNQKYETFKLKIDYYEMSIRGMKAILERLYTLKGIQKAALLKEKKFLERRNLDIFDNDSQLIAQTIFHEYPFEEEIKPKLEEFFGAVEDETFDFEVWNPKYDCLVEFTDFFFYLCDEMKKDDTICLCNLFKNCLERKRRELKALDHDTTIERKQLKHLIKQYDKKRNSVFYTISKEREALYTDIFESLLDDELNYYYFKRILEETKEDLTNQEIEKLLEEIIDRFIVNYKFKLANQGFHYVDPKYFESLLTLFAKEEFISLESKALLEKRLGEFEQYLYRKEGNISVPKAEALRDIENLYQKLNRYTKNERKVPNLNAKINHIMGDKMPYLLQNYEKFGFSVADESYKDYLYSTFAIGKYAYSKRYNEEGDLFFQIHVLDSSSIITENENMDDDLKENENVLYSFQYEQGKKYPVMTFQFRIYQNNMVGKMKIFSSMIEVDSIYDKSTLPNYRDIPDLKSLISAYKRIDSFSLEEEFDIDKITDSILSTHILEFLNGFDKEIPMMYRRDCGEIFEKLNICNHNQLCYYLSKIPKKQAHKIFYILDEKPMDIYTNYQTEGAYLSIEPFSYNGLYLLRTIKKLIRGNYSFHEEEYEREKKQVIEYCKKLNDQYGYIPEKIMKEDKKKNIDKRQKRDTMNS